MTKRGGNYIAKGVELDRKLETRSLIFVLWSLIFVFSSKKHKEQRTKGNVRGTKSKAHLLCLTRFDAVL